MRETALAADSQSFQHALLLLRAGDAPSACRWLEIAANNGHVPAMTMLGLYHAESGDRAVAVRWLTAAAEAGDESAMNFLGALYDDRGEVSSAVQWWGRAAQAGNSQAMFNLGDLLVRSGYEADGEGWIRAAAQAGSARARARLESASAHPAAPEPRHAPEQATPAPDQPARPWEQQPSTGSSQPPPSWRSGGSYQADGPYGPDSPVADPWEQERAPRSQDLRSEDLRSEDPWHRDAWADSCARNPLVERQPARHTATDSYGSWYGDPAATAVPGW
jgi:hypothetical protein